MTAPRRWSRREAVLVLLFAVLTAVAMTHPLAWELGSGGRVDAGDGRFAIWNVNWVARTLVADPTALLDANIFYPHRNTLAFSELNLVAGALAVPVYWLTRNPYATHNAVALLTFILSVVGGYALVRYLTGHRAAAAVASVLFAYCPFVFARTAHMQLLMIAGLPFGMLACHRLVDRPGPGRGAALGLVLAIVALACGYYALFTGLMVGVALAFYAVTRGLWRSPRYWASIAVAVTLGGLVAGLAVLPYLELGGVGRTLDDAREYSADWRAYLASPARAHGWILALIETWNEVLFPGFLTLGLAAAGAVVAWRTRLLPDAGPVADAAPPGRIQETAGLYALIGGLAFWASFGPDGGLYTVLFNVVPGFSMIRAPARFGITVALSLTVLGGVGVTRLARGRWTALIATALVLLALAELKSVRYPHVEAQRYPAAHRMLAQLPAGPVAEFPFFNRRMEFVRHTYYMVGSIAHWRPLINGYGDLIPQDFRDDVDTLAGFPSKASLDILERHATRYVVLHRALYDAGEWASLVERLPAFRHRLRMVFWDDDAWLLEMTGAEGARPAP